MHNEHSRRERIRFTVLGKIRASVDESVAILKSASAHFDNAVEFPRRRHSEGGPHATKHSRRANFHRPLTVVTLQQVSSQLNHVTNKPFTAVASSHYALLSLDGNPPPVRGMTNGGLLEPSLGQFCILQELWRQPGEFYLHVLENPADAIDEHRVV